MIVTSNGTMSVARKSTKIVRFSGKSRNANVYAASVAVATCPSVMKNTTTKLLRRYNDMLPSFHASA